MRTIYLEHCNPSDAVKMDKTWKMLFLSIFVEGDGISLGKPYVLDWDRISSIKVKKIYQHFFMNWLMPINFSTNFVLLWSIKV